MCSLKEHVFLVKSYYSMQKNLKEVFNANLAALGNDTLVLSELPKP